jgi:hypothetical protein
MTFELRVAGIDRKDLTEIVGEQSPFFIARVGGKPELDNASSTGTATASFASTQTSMF